MGMSDSSLEGSSTEKERILKSTLEGAAILLERECKILNAESKSTHHSNCSAPHYIHYANTSESIKIPSIQILSSQKCLTRRI